MVLKIQVSELNPVANVCGQILREVWKNEVASLAHVVMEPGNISLLHRHDTFTELYYILSGRGTLWLNGEPVEVTADSVVPIPPGTSHKLANTGNSPLVHQVFCMPPFNPNDVILLEKEPDETTTASTSS